MAVKHTAMCLMCSGEPVQRGCEAKNTWRAEHDSVVTTLGLYGCGVDCVSVHMCAKDVSAVAWVSVRVARCSRAFVFVRAVCRYKPCLGSLCVSTRGACSRAPRSTHSGV